MADEVKITEEVTPEVSEVIEEIKMADEDTLRDTIKKWYETTRTDGMKLGAQYISLGVYAAIRKHTSKPGKTSIRDYERMVKEIVNMLDVQLNLKSTEQNDSKEENKDDRTAEESSESNS